MQNTDTETVSSESKARRAAKKAGLIATKSRWRKDSVDNHGEFMLVEPSRNIAVAGWRYDMSADEVVEFCEDYLE
jgi:hypothetical protein